MKWVHNDTKSPLEKEWEKNDRMLKWGIVIMVGSLIAGVLLGYLVG